MSLQPHAQWQAVVVLDDPATGKAIYRRSPSWATTYHRVAKWTQAQVEGAAGHVVRVEITPIPGDHR